MLVFSVVVRLVALIQRVFIRGWVVNELYYVKIRRSVMSGDAVAAILLG